MSKPGKFRHIYEELKCHIPFTIGGALLGVIFMLAFKDVSLSMKEIFFKFAHPAHVLLSAMVTAAMFKIHSRIKNFLLLLIIGWVGAVGIATLSDILIPHFFGTEMLGIKIPVHSAMHEQKNASQHNEHTHNLNHNHTAEHKEHPLIHWAFIEEWYIVNPAAIIGALIAYFWPRTKFPHAGHVLLSTLASSAYVMMTTNAEITIITAFSLLIVLFVSVWLPCCISDIVFPLFFVKGDIKSLHCHHVGHHHHGETDEEKDEQ